MALTIILLFTLWQREILSVEQITFIFIPIALFFSFIGALDDAAIGAFVLIFVGFSIVAIANLSSIANIMIAVFSAATLSVSVFSLTLIAFGAALTIIIQAINAFKLDRWINSSRAKTNKELTDLIELESSRSPQECIELLKWYEECPDIQQYVQAVARQGRKLVFGEYKAAASWVEFKLAQHQASHMKIQAQQACTKLAQI